MRRPTRLAYRKSEGFSRAISMTPTLAKNKESGSSHGESLARSATEVQQAMTKLRRLKDVYSVVRAMGGAAAN